MMMRRLWLVMCCVVILTVGASAQTPEPLPSFENPRLTIEDGVLTIDDGTGAIVPGRYDSQLNDPVIYEQVIYQGNYPVIIGRIDDGTDNFLFATLSYYNEEVRTRGAGWIVNHDKYPNSRLFDIQVQDNAIAYLAIIGQNYPTIEWSGDHFPEEYLGKLIVYLLAEGTYPVTPPLEVSTTPDGETLYPTLEAFGTSYFVLVNGELRTDLPPDNFATITTVDGDRITYGNYGKGLLAWEPVDGRVLEWVEPEEMPFTPAVRVDGEVLPLALNGGYVWDFSEALITDDGRSVRLLKARIPNFTNVEENVLYWVELSPLKVVRLTYWNDSLTEASLGFLPDASGVLMSAYANFGDGTGGAGVWRIVLGEEPVLLTRDVPRGFSHAGMSIAPWLSVSADGFTLFDVSGETSQSYDLDGVPLLTEELSAALTATAAAAPSPTATVTPRPTYTADQLRTAVFVPITRNTDWTPVERDFDGVTMVLVPAGCFDMGSDDLTRVTDERPIHEQCFDQPFWIDKYEVTQAQFREWGGAPQKRIFGSLGDELPIEPLTWFDARNFCELRSGRLPTEAEWEYAARGPDSLIYPWGNIWDENNAVWFWAGDDHLDEPVNVGSIPAGASWVGALDMIGNVSEWTSSMYASYPYSADDGREADTGSITDIRGRVYRGGSWRDIYRFNSPDLRSSGREVDNFQFNPYHTGVRCARSYE